MNDTANELMHKVNTSKRSNFSGRKVVILLIISLFLLTVITGVVLFVKYRQIPIPEGKEPDKEVREIIKDLYSGQSIEIVEPLYVRARFARLESNILTYGVFSPVGAQTNDIELTERTVFGCHERYFTAPDGSKADSLQMLITTRGNEDIKDFPDPPNAKDLDWFKANVANGDAIEVYSIKNDEGIIIPRVVNVYKDACPN